MNANPPPRIPPRADVNEHAAAWLIDDDALVVLDNGRTASGYWVVMCMMDNEAPVAHVRVEWDVQPGDREYRAIRLFVQVDGTDLVQQTKTNWRYTAAVSKAHYVIKDKHVWPPCDDWSQCDRGRR
jgi:hypothetical protein